MTDHITGAQARELLEGATPGPWRWEDRDYPEHEEGYEVLWNGAEMALRSQDSDQYSSWVTGSDRDKALAAAAPALAETVAWLYGAEMTIDSWGDVGWHRHGGDGNLTLETDRYVEVETFLSDEEGPLVCVTTGPYGETVKLNAEEAVEMARALLHAAEKARRHTD